MAETIVTSVPDPSSLSPAIPISTSSKSNSHNNVHLELRNQKFTIDREALMELPESVLLCLFPNGVVLSQKHPQPPDSAHDQNSSTEDDDEQDEVYYVDFDGPCLSYILKFFSDARLSYYGTPIRQQEPPQIQPHLPSPLFYRQAIIVLREELEYFAIPPASQPSIQSPDPLAEQLLLELKRACGNSLLDKRSIFTALQRNVNRQNNLAEQHLIDMLCMSGFNREDDWGYRTLEPRRCCITSLALVLLKTGITHEHSSQVEMTGPDNSAPMNPQVNPPQLTTAQKLLLFWRKPARKCWWDATDLSVVLSDQSTRQVKLWARRVWTLELSLI